MKNAKGVTLIELLVVVTIIGILAAIALPMFKKFTDRAKVPDALIILASKALEMEQTYESTGAYACAQASWSTRYFNYECSSSADGFTVTATGADNMSAYSYSVNALGEHKTLAHPKGSSDNCWRISGFEC